MPAKRKNYDGAIDMYINGFSIGEVAELTLVARYSPENQKYIKGIKDANRQQIDYQRTRKNQSEI